MQEYHNITTSIILMRVKMIVIDDVDEDEMTLRQMRCDGDNDDICTGEI